MKLSKSFVRLEAQDSVQAGEARALTEGEGQREKPPDGGLASQCGACSLLQPRSWGCTMSPTQDSASVIREGLCATLRWAGSTTRQQSDSGLDTRVCPKAVP